jgi:hypothetical protein
MSKNIYDFFYSITKKYTIKEIADSLYVNVGTIKRWQEKKEVPSSYYFDLCRLSKVKVDYSQFTDREKDQFFTNKETAKYCFDKTKEILASFETNLFDYTLIEPSAGDGSFFDLFPKNNRFGLDIETLCDDIIQQDFLLWHPSTTKNICIGNPPFGLRGNLALKFINHAAKFSDFVCFILPQLFESNGKGSCKNRINGLNLIHSEKIDSNFYYPDSKVVSVNVVFQIWAKHYKIENQNYNLDNIIKLYSLSDGGTPSSTRNKKYLYQCDYYLPSTCFGEDCIKVYNNFEDLPHRRGYGIVILSNKQKLDNIINNINWKESAFSSTNGAYNLRFDIINKSIWEQIKKVSN